MRAPSQHLQLEATWVKVTEPARVKEAYRQREPAVVAQKQRKMLAHYAVQKAKMARKATA